MIYKVVICKFCPAVRVATAKDRVKCFLCNRTGKIQIERDSSGRELIFRNPLIASDCAKALKEHLFTMGRPLWDFNADKYFRLDKR